MATSMMVGDVESVMTDDIMGLAVGGVKLILGRNLRAAFSLHLHRGVEGVAEGSGAKVSLKECKKTLTPIYVER